MKHNKIFDKYYYSNIYWWEWTVATIIIILTSMSVTYTDIRSLTIWSTNFWDVFYERRFTEFYEYTFNNFHNAPHQYMGCDLFAIIPLSVWNIPIWIIQYFFHKEIMDFPLMIAWSKMGLLFFHFFISYFAKKITLLITEDKKRSDWAMLLTFSSCVAIMSICYAGQNDVFVIFYSTLCVYCIMNEKNKMALLFASLSIAVKPFFCFAYLPIVLLIEKNLIKDVLYFGLSFSIMILNRIIGVLFFSMYVESINQGPSVSVLISIFNVGINSYFGNASLFFMGLMILCFFVYFENSEHQTDRNLFLIYIPTTVYVLMSIFSKTEFYRSYLIMPFFFILIVSNISKFRLNLFLSFIYQAFFMLAISCFRTDSFNSYYINGSLFSSFFGDSNCSQTKDASFSSFILSIGDRGVELLLSVCSPMIVISALIILIINYPKFSYKFTIEKDGVFEKYDHGLLFLNFITFLPFLTILYFLYFVNYA